MWQTIKNSFKSKEVRTKILFTLLLVAIFRLGSFIPVPGIDKSVISGAVSGNTFLGIISAINGGALANGTKIKPCVILKTTNHGTVVIGADSVEAIQEIYSGITARMTD